MKFGTLYEVRVFDGVTEHQTYHNVLDQIVFAEKMGFEYVWMVEHHFTSAGSHMSAPEVFYGAVSQRTTKIRLGHGVVLLPHQFNPPVRVAERIAALDLLSNGRVEFGTGRSTLFEQLGMGVDPSESREQWEIALREIPKMWKKGPYAGWDGPYFKVPKGMNIVPKPLQDPHPRMWMAAAQPQSFDVAADLGLGVLAFAVGVPDRLTPHIARYKERVQNPANPASTLINNQVAAFVPTLCGRDDRATRDLIGRAYKSTFDRRQALSAGGNSDPLAEVPNAQYGQSLNTFYLDLAKQYEELGKPFPESLQYYLHISKAGKQMHEKRAKLQELEIDDIIDAGIVLGGDSASVRRGLERWEATGIDQIMIQPDWGGITHEQIMESYRLFGEEIIPHYAERAGGRETGKVS
jgi:alkanesulfonate monooxygenase SsuD/methylene tetrahydromethanopterin reductase-like flavin-dependent oxidoreductase (luciferase family)